MDTSKMKLIPAITHSRFEEFRDALAKTRRELEAVYEAVEAQVLNSQLARLFHEHYDLGEIREVYEVFGGYTNRSFGVKVEKDGVEAEYFVRKYKADVNDNDVLMEHGLIEHAISNGFDEAAGVFRAKDGRSFIRLDEIKGGRTVSRVYAVYRYLRGTDKYTWIDNHSTSKEYRNLGSLLGKFHRAAHQFVPAEGQLKTEPKVHALIPSFKKIFSERAARPMDSMFHAYFKRILPSLIEHMDLNAISQEEYERLPQCPVHGDFHCGNVRFEGEDTVGLYDFDWSKVDIRVFDLCLGLVYCCGSWDMDTDGHLRLDDCLSFLNGYNQAIFGSSISPLTADEMSVFARMLAAANFYLIYWLTELWYYLDPEGVNDCEAIAYLDHFIRGLNWMRNHQGELWALVCASQNQPARPKLAPAILETALPGSAP
jgi:homoserine kinase type II